MADRYDWDRDRNRDRERNYERGRESERDFGNERYGQERYGNERYGREGYGERGREDFDRERRFSGEGRFNDYGNNFDRGREDWDRQNRGNNQGWQRNEGRNQWSGDYRGYGGSERGDYNTQGDWGRSGSWGTYGNRPDFQRSNEGRREFESSRNWQGSGTGSFGGGSGSYSGGMGSYGEQQRGQHSGRGPKSWQRSDDRIREDINERLTDHPHLDASEIEVQVKNGEVTLTGTVEDRSNKRMAEDIADNVSGVKEVHNQLRVQQQQHQMVGGGQHEQSQQRSPTGTSTKRN